MGTPDFAVFSLLSLHKAGHEIAAVITQPDKPKGRGYTLTPPPVKVAATELGIPVYQPNTLKDEEFANLMSEIDPDICVVVAYGKILPKNVLDYPKYGCVNVHGSLLPEYRGAAPMQRAIIDGKTETGITTMYMAEGLDTGDMLLKDIITIEENDDFEAIHDKLGACGAKLIIKTLADIECGKSTRIPQEDALATYAAKITKEDCALDFNSDAQAVHDRIRGLSPIPLSFTHTPDGKLLKIIDTRIAKMTTTAAPGTVIALDGCVTVACGEGTAIEIHRLLPEGKGRMSAADYVRGRRLNVGDILS